MALPLLFYADGYKFPDVYHGDAASEAPTRP
jgi:hypothetical protein